MSLVLRRLAAPVASLAAIGLLLAPAVQAAPPQVTDTWAANVGVVVADLHAEIDRGGQVTTYRFNYLTEAAYEANLAAAKDPFAGASKAPVAGEAPVSAGADPRPATQHVALFKSATTYRYRVVAKNPAGEAIGQTRTLTTRPSGGGTLALPDNRAWELVSPVDKGGGEVAPPGSLAGGGVIQASADGSSLTFGSAASFGQAEGAALGSQYLAARTTGGWSTQNLTAPLLSGGYPDSGAGVPYQLFSADLGIGLLSNGQRCRGEVGECAVPNPPPPGSNAPAGYRNYYLRSGAGYQALLTSVPPLGPERFELSFAGATPDLAQVVLSSCAALSANAAEVPSAEGCDPAAQNLYRRTPAGLEAVNLLPAQGVSAPGAGLAAQANAISANGSRVYWTHGGNLYLRDGSSTVQVDAMLGGGAVFETASSDGRFAFITKAAHLHRFDATTQALVDLTPGGEVLGVLGASADGGRLYYLTASGLFLATGTSSEQIAAGADASNYPPATGTARATATGSHLAFLSSQELTGYDNDGYPQVFLYDATLDRLTCASCNPTGARALGPASIPGSRPNGELPTSTDSYKPRALSSDGRRLFFDTIDSLVTRDSDERADVYQWQAQGSGSCQTAGGCIGLISGGRIAGGSFLDASADGSSAFFLTTDSLVPRDPGSLDAYVARVGGGFPEPQPPLPCIGDACQGPPSAPEDPVPGTATLVGPSNPVLRYVGEKQKGGKGKKNKKGKGKKGKPKKQAKGKKKGRRR